MDDDSSFEDFSESLSVNSIEDEVPKKDVKKEDNPFEILSMERILEDVYSKVADVRSFTEVSIVAKNSFFLPKTRSVDFQ